MELEALHNCCKHGELIVTRPGAASQLSALAHSTAAGTLRDAHKLRARWCMTGFENVSRYCYWTPGNGDDNNDGDDKSDRGRSGAFF